MVGGSPERTPEIRVVVGADDVAELRERAAEIGGSASAAGLEVVYDQEGSVLDDEVEHFGFRDGISTPGPAVACRGARATT